jgi:hypothetical protein
MTKTLRLGIGQSGAPNSNKSCRKGMTKIYRFETSAQLPSRPGYRATTIVIDMATRRFPVPSLSWPSAFRVHQKSRLTVSWDRSRANSWACERTTKPFRVLWGRLN